MTEQPGKRIRVEVEEISFNEFIALISGTSLLLTSNLNLLRTARTRESISIALRRIIESCQSFPQRSSYTAQGNERFLLGPNSSGVDLNQERMRVIAEIEKLLILFKTTSVLENARQCLQEIVALAERSQVVIGLTGEIIDMQPNEPGKLLPKA